MKYLPIDFVSNPVLPEAPMVVPEQKDGVIVNTIKHVPVSNKSYFDGVEFNASTMSLRAKLNLGLQLHPVSIGQVENDPNVLRNRALHMEKEIFDKLESLQSQEPSVDPSNP